MSERRELADRVTHLEIALAHQQRDFEVINRVVTDQADQIDRLRGAIGRLTERLEAQQATAEASPRRLEDDRPPHY